MHNLLHIHNLEEAKYERLRSRYVCKRCRNRPFSYSFRYDFKSRWVHKAPATPVSGYIKHIYICQ